MATAANKAGTKKAASKKAASKKAAQPARRISVKKSSVVKDFSVVENGAKAQAASTISRIASTAGTRAAAAAKAMGLPKIYATQKEVVRVSADGKSREVVSTPGEGRKTFYRKYTKGTVLHARKK